MDILQKILVTKKQEVQALQRKYSLQQLEQEVQKCQPTKGFEKSLQHSNPAIIAEVKKASPSKGIIRKQFDPIAIAKSYQKYGATCLSVLTDQQYFKGHNDYLTAIRHSVSLPLLRKDFIIDPYQIYEARIIGADCILLIAAALTLTQLQELTAAAKQLTLDVLVEVHNQEELEMALTLDTSLLGINNRNLHTFKTDLNTTIQLLNNIPNNKLVISESGIHTKEDVHLLMKHQVHAFLIGEAFMRLDEPGLGLTQLFGCLHKD